MAMKNQASKSGVKHKYHGLVNQGATCYLNSVLQVLFMTEDFRESVKKTADTTYIDFELRDLFQDLEKQMAYTHRITNRLNIKNVCVQRDAAEHYEKILRLTSPEASQIFHGKLINRNKCKQCDTKYDSPAGFWSLPLPLVNNTEEYSVEKGIEDFFRSSEISGDDQMYCEECDDKRDAVLDCVVEHHPEVLVLLLKRFEFDYEYTYTYVKNQSCVNVPDTLQTPGNQSYKLYAIVEHFGELKCGHYISTIKSQGDDTWYEFNDSTVTQRSTLPALERSGSAYLLFYRKLKVPKDNPKRPRPDDESQESVHGKKPKQELSGEELNFDGKVQKCEDLDTGSSSANTQTIDSQFYPNDQEGGERPNPPEPAHNSAGDVTSGGTLVNTENTNGFGTGERLTQTSKFNTLGREAVGADGSTNQFEDCKPKYAQREGQGSLRSDDKPKIVKTEEPFSETWQQQVKHDTQDILGTIVVGADGSTNRFEDFRLGYAQREGQGSIQSDDKPKIVKTEEPLSETWQQQVKHDTQDILGTIVVGADGSTNRFEDFRLGYAQGEGQGSLQSDDKPKIVKTEEPLSETWQQQVKHDTQDILGTIVVGADGSTNRFEDFRLGYAQGEGQGSLQSDDKPKIVKTEEPLSETWQQQVKHDTQDILGTIVVGADGSTNRFEDFRLGYAQGEGQGSLQSDDKPKIVKTEEPLSETWQQQVKHDTQDILGTIVVGADGSTNRFEDFRLEYAQGEGQGSLQSDDKPKIVKTEEPLSETWQQQVKHDTQDILGTIVVGADGSTNRFEDFRLGHAQREGQGSLRSDDKPKIVKTEEPLSETWQQQVKHDTQDILGTIVVGADGSTNRFEDFRLGYAQREGQGSIQSDDQHKIVKTEEPLSETWQQQVKHDTQDILGTIVVGADGSTNRFEDFRLGYAQREGQGSIQSDDQHKIAKTEEPLSETCQHQFTCETQDFLRRESECSAGADGSTNQPKVYTSRYSQGEEQPEKYGPACALGEGQGSYESDDKSTIVKIEKPSSETFQHQVKREFECSAGADGSTNQPEKTRPECAQGEGQGSLQSDDKSKTVKLCGSSDNGCDYGSCEGSELHMTEKQEQNIDLADTTLPATHLETEETSERENENENDTRFQSQNLSAGGNSLDQQTESPTEIVECKVYDASPMNLSSPVCGYTEEESVRKQGHESGLLRESGFKNTDEKEGECGTDESSQDRDLKGHPKESFISAEGEKEEKAGSNCTDSIREVVAPCDCSTSVNQNDTEPAPSALNRDLTRSVDTRERTAKTHFQNVSKSGVKKLLTKYDLYLSSFKSNSYERSNVHDEEKLKKEPGLQAESWATRGLQTECRREGEGNKGDVLSDTQTRGKEIQSQVVERRGGEEIIRITLKKSK